MKLPKKFFISKARISKLDIAISKAIDKVCEEENFEITYAEIRQAMLRVMTYHNELELKEERGIDK